MKKGDVGMAKRFSKKYGNKGWHSTTCNPMSRCLSVPDATPHEAGKVLQLLYRKEYQIHFRQAS